ATIVGWGPNRMSALTGDSAPYNTMSNFYWGKIGIVLLTLALMNSSWGCSLAGQNAVVRVIYKMGQVGVLPKVFASVHPKYQTPSFPLNLAPYIDIVWILIGIGTVVYLGRTRPQQLQAGAQAIFAETGAASDLPR